MEEAAVDKIKFVDIQAAHINRCRLRAGNRSKSSIRHLTGTWYGHNSRYASAGGGDESASGY